MAGLLALLGLAGGCIEASTFLPLGGIETDIAGELYRLDEGGSLTIPVTVERGPGRDGEIALQIAELPTGVTTEGGRIEAGATTGTILLHASGASIGAETTLVVKAQEQDVAAEAMTKIFIAGKSGTVDPAYGVQGKITFPFSMTRIRALRSGGFLIAGLVANMITLVRLTPEGALDLEFGDGGYFTLPFPGGMTREQSSVFFLEEQADGKVLLATGLDDATTTERPDYVGIARLLPDGAVDQTYGNLGYALIAGPLRVYGLVLGLEGELLLWHGAASDSRLSRILPSGVVGASSPTFAPTMLTHGATEMVVQPDGRVVIPGYEFGPVPAMFRFDRELRLDASFGRGGIVATRGAWFGLRAAPGGGYAAAGFVTGGAPSIMRFDSLLRPLDGFAGGGIDFPGTGNFVSPLSIDGATLAIAKLDNAARIGRVLDSGMIDSTYGVAGLSNVTFLATGDFVAGMEKAPRFGLFVVVVRSASLSTEIHRVWQ